MHLCLSVFIRGQNLYLRWEPELLSRIVLDG